MTARVDLPELTGDRYEIHPELLDRLLEQAEDIGRLRGYIEALTAVAVSAAKGLDKPAPSA